MSYCTNGHTVAQNYIKNFSECDILIYQPISERWGIGNTENKENGILKFVKPECQKICFPYIHLDMLPLINDNNLFLGGSCIDKYKSQSFSLDQILNLYDNESFDFELRTRFRHSIEYMRYKENAFCNVKVVNYILENYKTTNLIDSHNHINGVLGSYISKQIYSKIVSQPSEKDIDILNQTMYKINKDDVLPYSKYMKRELDIDYPLQSRDEYYREIIISIYNNPNLIKRSNLFYV